MDPTAFITDLMHTEPNALGFIPSTSIRNRYVNTGRYSIVRDAQGTPRGYLIWGPIKPGRPVYITQVCTEREHRLHGVAAENLHILTEQARRAGCPGIFLRCALDLEANLFWKAAGFLLTHIGPGDNKTGRLIAAYWLPLHPPHIF